MGLTFQTRFLAIVIINVFLSDRRPEQTRREKIKRRFKEEREIEEDRDIKKRFQK